MAGKFVLKTAADGQTYFRLQAGNGEGILKSEMYKSKASALNGIESVKKNAADENRFVRKDAAGGQFMFNLLAGNRQVIGSSELYKAAASRDAGIKSVQANAPGAATDDQT